MGGQSLGGNFENWRPACIGQSCVGLRRAIFCAESDFEVRFAKFGHLTIAQNGSRRVSGKKRALGNRVHVNVLKSRSKGWIKKHRPHFSHIDADFKNFKKGFGARLLRFHLLIEIAPDFDKM